MAQRAAGFMYTHMLTHHIIVHSSCAAQQQQPRQGQQQRYILYRSHFGWNLVALSRRSGTFLRSSVPTNGLGWIVIEVFTMVKSTHPPAGKARLPVKLGSHTDSDTKHYWRHRQPRKCVRCFWGKHKVNLAQKFTLKDALPCELHVLSLIHI